MWSQDPHRGTQDGGVRARAGADPRRARSPSGARCAVVVLAV